MMKVFLDTNILLDYGQRRDEFYYAKVILELGERNEIELYYLIASYILITHTDLPQDVLDMARKVMQRNLIIYHEVLTKIPFPQWKRDLREMF